MRLLKLHFHAIICLVLICEAYAGRRTRRTLSFDFSPSKWQERLSSLVTQGKMAIFQLPTSGVQSFLRLVAYPNNEKMSFIFGPEDGPRASHAYRQKFGFRGQNLIDSLGLGSNEKTHLNQSPGQFQWKPVLSPQLQRDQAAQKIQQFRQSSASFGLAPPVKSSVPFY